MLVPNVNPSSLLLSCGELLLLNPENDPVFNYQLGCECHLIHLCDCFVVGFNPKVDGTTPQQS